MDFSSNLSNSNHPSP